MIKSHHFGCGSTTDSGGYPQFRPLSGVQRKSILGDWAVIRFMPPPRCGLRQWPQGRHLAPAGAGPFEGGVAHPGANVPRESASKDTTTPAAFAAVARCFGVKSGSGCEFFLNIGLPLGVSKLAQFRTFRPRHLPLRHMLPPLNRQRPARRQRWVAGAGFS